MIFEPTQLCFSSNYIDDFREINRSEGSLNAISFFLKSTGEKPAVSPTSKISGQFHKV